MSRPFSYNDENFNVIGNILFVHFKYKDEAPIGTRLIEIPPAIGDRLLFFSNTFSSVYTDKNASSGTIVLSVIEYNGKFYLSNKANMGYGGANRYLFGIFMLKDI